jgi:hypothetical protein
MGDDQHVLMHILEYKYGGNVISEPNPKEVKTMVGDRKD